ncbi:MAG TPA: helix-turn-helix domain-containing protein [Acidimicrobiales bacterium]|nr:helix-turn-helix domain-containing protein [Acidimicrobiales bacterium]
MAEPVKRRAYKSAIRREQAARTRASIIDAAAELFVAEGYAATTMRAIADRAGVAPDTVYASFGSKVRVLTGVIDARLAPSGQQNVMDRPAALAVRDEPDQRAQLRRFAQDIAAISTRVRPIYEVLRTASASEPEVRDVFAEMEQHRLANMRRLASWLGHRGDLLVDEDRAAEIIWVLASPDVARMLCDVRGWSEDEYAHWLDATLASTLVPTPAATAKIRTQRRPRA